MLQFGKFPYNTDTDKNVPCQTGNTLCNHQIHFSGSAICQHPHAFRTVLKHRPADPLVSINSDKRPMRVMLYKVLVIPLLQLI